MRYQVSREVTMWIEVEADNEDDALQKACNSPLDDWWQEYESENIVLIEEEKY